MAFRFILLLSSFSLFYQSIAQVQPCLDVVSKKRLNGAGQGVYDFNNKWTPGTTLTVSFLDGTE